MLTRVDESACASSPSALASVCNIALPSIFVADAAAFDPDPDQFMSDRVSIIVKILWMHLSIKGPESFGSSGKRISSDRPFSPDPLKAAGNRCDNF